MLLTLAQETTPDLVHYLPLGTTALSVSFVVALLLRARTKKWAPHLVWWAIGVACYGLGTAFESAITLWGNTVALNRWWYWAGAVLGGYPLATGSLYLLAPRKVAHWLTAVSLVVVVFTSVVVFMAPMDAAGIAASPHRPGGKFIVEDWAWVRLMTPFINGYAAIFLIGGAAWSCWVFLVKFYNPSKAWGTGLIAVGALLPGIGGSMAKAGIVEALYIGEFVGLVLICIGYYLCIRVRKPFPATEAREAEGVGKKAVEGA